MRNKSGKYVENSTTNMNDLKTKCLDTYRLGWNNELNNIKHDIIFDSSIENVAYQDGITDAIYGDDCTSLDYQSDEQIFDNILNNYHFKLKK